MDLIPAVVQHHATGHVLMVAYMNDEALRLTCETGQVHFWSRSRKRLWKKGESSGNTLRLVELRLDCDHDCLLVRADPAGPACHTGQATCFFSDTDGGAPAGMLDQLYRTILERKQGATSAKSYTRSLLNAGMGKIIGKIVEECGELCAELPEGSKDRLISECADLFYHVLVGLGAREVDPNLVLLELARRAAPPAPVKSKKRTSEARSAREPKTQSTARAARKGGTKTKGKAARAAGRTKVGARAKAAARHKSGAKARGRKQKRR
jgi:phosphoribosyl-ATP pyrophosphohydrolase/phosphoribosyl-AMP cyclohydrolase